MKKLKFSLIIILCIGLMGCKKGFLDISDPGNLTRQSYVTDLKGLIGFRNGIYIMLSQRFSDGIGAAYADLAADNLKPRNFAGPKTIYNWAQEKNDAADIAVSVSSKNLNGIYRNGYLIIRACNFVIEEADKYSKEDAAMASSLKGEALAIRAMVHFRLVNCFAQPYVFLGGATHPGVPYIKDSDITKPFSRQNVAEVYDNLIEDLRQASKYLPEKVSDTRYMNRLAAKALLAQVFLFKGDYENASVIAVQISNYVPLMSIAKGYPDQLFALKDPGNTEVLFQAPPLQEVSTRFIGNFFRSSQRYFDATNDIYSLLNEDQGDIRKTWVGQDLTVNKFPLSIAGIRSVPAADYYQPYIRASEMYLTAAESFANLGKEDKAREYLNLVRKRASPLVQDVNLSGAPLLLAIQLERRKEFCFEGMRLFDLQRNRASIVRTDGITGSPRILAYPSDKSIAPIPMQDVSLAGVSQNQGY